MNRASDVADIAFQVDREFGGGGEYVSAAYMGLLDAERLFRADKGMDFKAYAACRARNAVRDQKRYDCAKRSRARGRDAKHTTITRQDRRGKEYEFLSVMPVDTIEQADTVRQMVKHLPPRRKMALLMMADGIEKQDIAKAIGVVPTWIGFVLREYRRYNRAKA